MTTNRTITTTTRDVRIDAAYRPWSWFLRGLLGLADEGQATRRNLDLLDGLDRTGGQRLHTVEDAVPDSRDDTERDRECGGHVDTDEDVELHLFLQFEFVT